jgi:hypothetical protein
MSTNILDSLKDIIKHTNSLGFIDMVKVVGTATDAKIEAIDADKTVVIFGSMYQPITGIDTTVGLSRIAILKGYIDFPLFSTDKSAVDIVSELRGTVNVPSEIKFDSGAGHTANYRFMGESMINEQIKVPPFKGATWNVTIQPEKKKIAELAYFQGVLGGFEKRFVVSVDAKGTLNFNVGSGPTDRTIVPFATNVTGTLKHQWSWPLAQVLGILKLSETASTTTMNFSDMGALKIDIDSGIGKYSYILPAGKA